MNIINLTPHPVTIIDGEDVVAVYHSVGIARVVETTQPGDPVDGIPTVTVTYGAVEGLPDPTPGTLFVVSRVVAAAVERDDLVFPSGEVRDKDGRIIGCRSLGRFPTDYDNTRAVVFVRTDPEDPREHETVVQLGTADVMTVPAVRARVNARTRAAAAATALAAAAPGPWRASGAWFAVNYARKGVES